MKNHLNTPNQTARPNPFQVAPSSDDKAAIDSLSGFLTANHSDTITTDGKELTLDAFKSWLLAHRYPALNEELTALDLLTRGLYEARDGNAEAWCKGWGFSEEEQAALVVVCSMWQHSAFKSK